MHGTNLKVYPHIMSQTDRFSSISLTAQIPPRDKKDQGAVGAQKQSINRCRHRPRGQHEIKNILSSPLTLAAQKSTNFLRTVLTAKPNVRLFCPLLQSAYEVRREVMFSHVSVHSQVKRNLMTCMGGGGTLRWDRGQDTARRIAACKHERSSDFCALFVTKTFISQSRKFQFEHSNWIIVCLISR